MQRNDLLVWVDLEMTSIDNVLIDRITEIAVVLTDKDLNVVAELPSIIIHTEKSFYDARKRPEMRDMPLQNELVEASDASTTTLEEAEAQVLAFLKEHVAEKSAPLCGNTIHMDRHFIRIQMPLLDQYLFYRCIDVSALKELARRWAPDIYKEVERRKENKTHRAMDDIRQSIEELRFYRDNFLKI
jgi:oligoribonuclease